ncbi:MAG: electron transport complex subunit RsxC [Thalassolituus sp.]|jgi:electron transport complex protein RnfC|uniref:electron transport complex subunit RsxC n=1 Tax=Thalassolituus sp. TaxID=2030822 RepID=UPI0027D58F32|nr:electron transport complex subunit RsxC [Thalassolituus sp.]MDQ4423881.1 electron transport complex subunit RsxC [Thalassolituus sp.]MDQ4425397.1 electron transport complex subunit RsxC [Thalassolituus sp.]
MTHLIQLHEFDGGIHPPENKRQSNSRPIRKASLPAELVLPLHQHIGAPANPVVAVGDSVLKGQVIAEPEGFVSAPLHAPTSGKISAIEARQVPHASGLSETCIVIEPDGEETWAEHQGLCDALGLEHCDDIPKEKLIERIRDCGIAGMGGAGFPTAVKLHTGQHNIDTLILNGAECEPYITADDMLMREHASEVIRGAQILLQILGAERCLIGVEDNKPEAIAALEDALVQHNEEHHIDVVTIPTKYPSGGEKQLIQILTGKEVPSGGIPASLGIVCQNVGTAAAIADAVDLGRPLISRITTVTGDAVRDKGNWEVLLGTPVSHLLSLSGYRPAKRERVVMGGPMMGFALPTTGLPVVKTTNCLLAPTDKELPTNNPAMACIRCGLCADACPADLLPQQLYWFSKAQEFDKAEQHNLFDCIECGACSYVCPSEIPLVQYYRFSKGAIREERAAAEKAEQARIRYEARIERQEREKAEKEAKRKARAEAAAKAQSAKKEAPIAKAAPTTESTATEPTTDADLEKLQKQLSAAQAAVAKTKEKLEAARENPEMADKIPAFESALTKTQDKIKTLAKEIAAAKKAAKAAPAATGPDKGDPNSPERLQKKWETAAARLDTARKRLEDAEAEGADTVDALRTGVEKQEARVAEAKAAYEAALKSGTDSKPTEATATKPDAEQLQKKLLAQKDRVEKARERLEMARAEKLDSVDALEKALNKQLEKLAAFEAQTSTTGEV